MARMGESSLRAKAVVTVKIAGLCARVDCQQRQLQKGDTAILLTGNSRICLACAQRLGVEYPTA